jgi:hypothetical protein
VLGNRGSDVGSWVYLKAMYKKREGIPPQKKGKPTKRHVSESYLNKTLFI